MIYILETKLYENKSVFFALTSVYGISQTTSFYLSKKLGFSKNLKIKNLSGAQIKQLLKLVRESELIITSDLKKIKNLLVKNLVFIKSYRGLRRIKGLPVRGQRTHTNAKTARKIKK